MIKLIQKHDEITSVAYHKMLYYKASDIMEQQIQRIAQIPEHNGQLLEIVVNS